MSWGYAGRPGSPPAAALRSRQGLAVWLALLASCGGCRDRGSLETRKRKVSEEIGRPLRVHMDHEPPALLPMLQPDSWAKRITSHQLFEALVRHDPRPPYALVGELASRFSRSADGLSYTFDLRQGVSWHDGKPFSSKDVAFTLSRLLDPNVRAVSTRATLAPFIASHEAVSRYRYRITCKRRSPFFWPRLPMCRSYRRM